MAIIEKLTLSAKTLVTPKQFVAGIVFLLVGLALTRVVPFV